MARSLLLTGATGALGPPLAMELLSACAADRINVLMRPGNGLLEERFDRWMNTVASLGPDGGGLPVDLSRLRMIQGDVALEGLGLDAAEENALTSETETIIHAAADTRFRGPPQEQWNTNVEGTRRLLDFARRCPRLRKFILVSTICVAGSSTGSIPEVFAHPPSFTNPYEQTKWQAEQLVLASGLPVQVARISIIVGSHATGMVHRLGALHHALRWFGRGLIPVVPGTPQTTVDLIAVETAARFLAKAAVTDTLPAGAIWHVAAGTHAAPLTEMVKFTWDHSNLSQTSTESHTVSVPRIVDAATFHRLHRSDARRRDPVQGHVVESIDSFLPGLLLHPRTFDTTQAQALWGGPLPLLDWRQTLQRVLDFLGQTAGAKVGRRPFPVLRPGVVQSAGQALEYR